MHFTTLIYLLYVSRASVITVTVLDYCCCVIALHYDYARNYV